MSHMASHWHSSFQVLLGFLFSRPPPTILRSHTWWNLGFHRCVLNSRRASGEGDGEHSSPSAAFLTSPFPSLNHFQNNYKLLSFFGCLFVSFGTSFTSGVWVIHSFNPCVTPPHRGEGERGVWVGDFGAGPPHPGGVLRRSTSPKTTQMAEIFMLIMQRKSVLTC